MLIVFGGLPGTGKTTLAREVSRRCDALYLRIDTIEQSIRTADVSHRELGAAGYAVAMALARDNVAVGRVVVADAVNPVAEARMAWRDIATRLAVPLLQIEIVCSDAREHRRRVESRRSDIDGLVPPTWEEVLQRHYEPWNEDHWVIDTSVTGADEAVEAICARIEG